MTPVRIVVVEDEAAIALDLQAVLEDAGYVVPEIAATVPEALAAIARHRPDLVLLDIRLADGSSGITIAEELYRTAETPVIFLTAHADADTIARATAAQPYHYLLKPFNEREMLLAVRLALSKSASDRALRTSEQRYATTLRSIADGVIVTDSAQQITFLNPAAATITGWSSDDAVGHTLPEVVDVQLPGNQLLNDVVVEVQRSGRPASLPRDALLQRRDGTTRLVTDSIAPVVDAQGAAAGVVLVLQDVTEQRTTEEAQRRTERKLLETQRLESLGVMAAGIAHDFNNLLAVIVGNIELAQGDLAPSSDSSAVLQQALASATRAAALTQQLLAYVGKRPRETVVTSLHDVLAGVGDLARAAVANRGVVTWRLAPSLPLVEVDPTQIQQVVLNLLTNAAEALGAEGGAIAVAAYAVTLSAHDLSRCVLGAELPPGRYVALEVQDSGSGMDAQTAERMFDPFFTTKFAGRGLGLAVVHGIARAHRAALEVQSAERHGTTIRLFLPAAAEDAPSLLHPSEGAMHHQANNAAAGNRGTLLVIDDDEAVRQVTARLLDRLGFQVQHTDDVPTALRWVAAGLPELRAVLLDLTMPSVSGRSVAEMLLALRPELPIIIMSGYAAEEVALQHEAIGVQGFVQKPFTQQTLARALAALRSPGSGSLPQQ